MNTVLFFGTINSIDHVQDLVPRNYCDAKKQIKESLANLAISY